jgi:hypothetical protein
MDDSMNQRRETPARESSNTDVSLGIMFVALGATLMGTLDTPWAGLPLIGVGLFYLGKSIRDVRRRRAPADETLDA